MIACAISGEVEDANKSQIRMKREEIVTHLANPALESGIVVPNFQVSPKWLQSGDYYYDLVVPVMYPVRTRIIVQLGICSLMQRREGGTGG